MGKRAHVASCLSSCPQDASSRHQLSSWFTGCVRKGVFKPLQRRAGSLTGLDWKLPRATSVLGVGALPVAVHPRAAAAAAARRAGVQPPSSAGWDPAPYSRSLPPLAPASGCCGLPAPPPERAPSEEQGWVPNRVCTGEWEARGEASLHHTSPPGQGAPDLLKAIATRRLHGIAPSEGSGSACAALTSFTAFGAILVVLDVAKRNLASILI